MIVKTCKDYTYGSSVSKRKNSQLFGNNINDPIHRFLKNMVCMWTFSVNYSDPTQSCLCCCAR